MVGLGIGLDLTRQGGDPSLLYANDFTVSTSGWSTSAGTFNATASGGDITNSGAYAFRDFGITDVDFRYSEQYNGSVGGAVFRYQDTTNTIRMYYTTSLIVLDYRVGGGFVTITTSGITTVLSGEWHDWRITIVDDAIEIFFDGVSEISTTLPVGADPLAANTNFGFRTSTGGLNYWTDHEMRTPS